MNVLIGTMLDQAEFQLDLSDSARRAYTRPVAVLRELVGNEPIGRLTNEHFRTVIEAEWRQSLERRQCDAGLPAAAAEDRPGPRLPGARLDRWHAQAPAGEP
jgi:hypothetical protein